MKKILYIPLFIAVLVLAIPALIGFKVEEQYGQLLAQLARDGAQIASNQYERGWFGAEVETELVLTPAAADQSSEPLHIVLRSRIQHGPFTENGIGLAEIGTWLQVQGESLSPDQEPAPITTLVDPLGRWNSRLRFPQKRFTPQVADAPTIDFAGLSGKLAYDPAFGKLSLRADLPGLVIHAPQGDQIRLKKMRLESRMQRGSSGISLGEGGMYLEQLDFAQAGNPVTLSLQGLGLNFDSYEREGLVYAGASYRVRSVKGEDGVFGPGRLRLEMKRLAAAPLLQIQQGMEQLRRRHLSPEQARQEMQRLLSDVAPELLQANPGIVFKPVTLVTPDGTLKAALSLESRDLKWSEVTNPVLLMEKLAAEASLRIPEKLFRRLLGQQIRLQIAQLQQAEKISTDLTAEQLDKLVADQVDGQLQQLVRQGVLERDGEYLATVARFSDGLLTVNGKTIPLAQLLQLQ